MLSDRADIANARLELNLGCVANITASRVSAERIRKLRIFAPPRYYSIDYHQQRINGVALEVSGGERRFVAPLARAAVALGVDGLFVEAHPDPENAPCDGPSQIDFESLDGLLGEVTRVARALR